MALSVNIQKKLGSFCLDVDLEAEGGVLALLGASGCGKSMTLKCIAGIEKPDSGRIVLDGRVLYDSEQKIDLPPQKRKVGYLFQNYALFPHMTIRQNIAAGIRSRRKDSQRIEEAVHAMHLEGLEDRLPARLSGGQQQRAALARILVNEPEVLLLDEPFSALDSHLRFRLEQQLRNTMREFGKTVLFVSHNRDEAYRLSDRMAVLHDGKIQVIGTKKEVFRAPKTRKGAVLTGCKNISPIQKLDERHVTALDWGMELELAQDAEDASYVGIRMHDVIAGESSNRFWCQVEEEIENPFSYTIMLRKEGADGQIGWEMDKERWKRMRNDRVQVALPPESILLLKE